MDAREVLAVCIVDEAANQAHAGRVAVGIVVMNRTRLKFQSDGSVLGTVLRKDQVSGFWFSMVAGKYTRVARTYPEALARLAEKYRRYSAQPALWADCLAAADQAQAIAGIGFKPGESYQGVTSRTVNYVNLAIVKRPAWATPDKLDAKIGDHSFFHA